MNLSLTVGSEVVDVSISRVINAGYSGRDEAAVRAHIDELVEEGVPRPDQVPVTFGLAPTATLVDAPDIWVAGKKTSGEAEYGLVFTGEETLVVAASDHTDRELETLSLQKSKQIAPNVISERAWRLEDVREQWDTISLRSWTRTDDDPFLYQDGALGELIRPDRLADLVRERYDGGLAGTLVLSGTIPTVSETIAYGSEFEVRLVDDPSGETLEVSYRVHKLPE